MFVDILTINNTHMILNYKWFLTCLLLLTIQLGFAQNKTLTGIVTEEGLPLPGVTVVVDGTQLGTQTSLDGSYSISVKEGEVIVFSFIGMNTVKHKVGTRTVFNVELTTADNALDEVVVTAYGTQTKSSVAGSIAKIDAAEIKDVVASNVTQGLVGKVSGVQIMNTSGAPGQDTTIRFRGIGSLSASADPLIVLDGVPYNGTMNSINSADIDNISFLKDASSAALYGNRGANGVIIITTKKGTVGDVKVSFDTKVGLADKNFRNVNKITDPAEYYQAYHSAMRSTAMRTYGYDWTEAGQWASDNLIGKNGSTASIGNGLGYNIYDVDNKSVVNPDGTFNPNAKLLYHESYDDFIFRNGFVNQNNLSVSGGTEKTKFYLSVGYDKNDGIVETQSYNKTMTRLNLDSKINKTFEIGGALNYSNISQKNPMGGGYEGGGGSAFVDPFMWTNRIAPIYPVHAFNEQGEMVKDANGNPYFDDGKRTYSPYLRPWGASSNAYAEGINNYRKSNINQVFGSGYLNINLAEGLAFKYVVSADLYANSLRYTQNPVYGSGMGVKGRATQIDTNIFAITNQQLLTYNKWFGNHNIDVLLGHETLDRNRDELYAQRTNLAFPDSPFLDQAATIVDGGGGNQQYKLEGYFAKANYGYDNKYFVNASIRRDASSYFAPENQWGTFYGVGAAWVMSQENFMTDISWLDYLKLKASYGEQGNDNLKMMNPYQDSWSIKPSFDGSAPISMSRDRVGNRDITWEKNKNFNTGFEFSVLNSRLTVDAEYFQRVVNDMLFMVPQPTITGVKEMPYNAGDMINKGFEVSLTGEIIRKEDFRLSVNLNATHYKNKITRLPEGIDNIVVGQFRRSVGRSAYGYYLKEYVGVDKTNGNAQFIKVEEDGTRTIVNDWNEATYQDIDKTSLPTVYGGMGINVEYKGFDASVQLAYQLGGYGLDGKYNSYFQVGPGQNMVTEWRDTWTPENQNSDNPMLLVDDKLGAYNTSTRTLIKSDYLSIQNITVGYTFTNTVTSNLGLSNLRIYGLVDNAALWSKRKGYDPRLNLSGLAGTGYNLFSTYMLGVNVQF